MSQRTGSETVGSIVAASPLLASVFEKFKIDYCCQGQRKLEEACRDRGVDLGQVLASLAAAQAGASSSEPDWNRSSLEALVDNILTAHHNYLRTELPRLEAMLSKVVRVHSGHHPELVNLQNVFRNLTAELQSHMMKEEQVLFPAIVRLERNRAAQAPCGSLIHPIHVMEHEHAAVGQMLVEIQSLTAGYMAPGDACNTFRVLYDSLQRLETDLHLHIHKENNILFPRAYALEQESATESAVR